MRFCAFVVCVLLAGLWGCGECQQTGPRPAAAARAPKPKVPQPPAAAAAPAAAPAGEVSPARAAYYRTALPQASRFERKAIPREMLAPVDRGNDTYLMAYNDANALVGYLRDFSGPVSPADECPCHPLSLTMVFDAQQVLQTILSPSPLEKLGHEPMTQSEQARVIEIAKSPPEALMRVRRVEDVVDATTGATRRELADHVVANAGLTTRRVAGVVRDTQRILQGAPASRDRAKLEEIMSATSSDRQRARALAAYVPSVESIDLKPQVYRLLLGTYLQALGDDAGSDAAVEAVLLEPRLGTQDEHLDVASACYRLVSSGKVPAIAEPCMKALGASGRPALPAEVRALLQGTISFMAGDMKAAAPALATAAQAIPAERDPLVHLRLSQALAANGESEPACAKARALYLTHPLLPGAQQALVSCKTAARDVPAVVAELQAEQKQTLLAGRRASGQPVPALEVEGPNLQQVELGLAERNKVTVAVFFATWCPHCQAELPHVVKFVEQLASHPALTGRVRVVGIRTAVERETEPYDAFASRFRLNFPVWTDATMSMAFSRFAKSQGLTPGLPTTAIIDDKGLVQFFIEPGDHKDVAQELLWAVEAVLKPGGGKSS